MANPPRPGAGPRQCPACGCWHTPATRRVTCSAKCAARRRNPHVPIVAFRARAKPAASGGPGRSVMDARGIVVADPAAMVAAGVRLVDGYGREWLPLDLPELAR